MGDTGGDPRGQHDQGRPTLRGRSTKRIGDEDGSSSGDDFGLRRRFVSVHHEKEVDRDVGAPSEFGKILGRPEPSTTRETAAEEAVDDSTERNTGEKIRLGAESRRILDLEDPDHGMPLMMKKKKKKNVSTGQPTDNYKPEKPKTPKNTKTFPKKLLFLDYLTGDDMRGTDPYVIYVMRDFMIYLIFMIITSVVIFGATGPADNYFAIVLEDLVVKSKFSSPRIPGHELTFYDIDHRQDMWAFIDQVVLELVYEKAKYSQDPDHFDEGYQVMLENMLFGVPQLRQVRVKGKTCEPAPLFDGIFDDCADYYSEAIEDTTTFRLDNKTAWKYQPATPEHVPVAGIFSTYGGGGFTINLRRSLASSRTWITELKRDAWIRFGTRAVILDLNFFNVNTQLFCATKLVFEMAPIGGIVPKAYFTTVKLVWYSGPWGYFILSCHIAFVGFIIFYTYEEISQIIRWKMLYLGNWWNVLDLTIVLGSYVTIALAITSIVTSHDFLIKQKGKIQTNEHVSFDRLVLLQSRYHVAQAIIAFFVWVKILKFSALNRTVSLVLTAFAKVRYELIAATVLLATLLFGFALLGTCIAGALFQQLASVWTAMITLFGLLGGGIHFYFTHKVHEAPFRAWLLLYIISVIVIYINIYVALIVHGFELALTETDNLSNTAQFGDIAREFFCRFLLCIRKPHIVANIKLREEENQNIRIYSHLAAILSRHGFDNREIGLIFNKHGVHFGKKITIETLSQIYEEINVRNQLFVETEGHNQITEQLEKIVRNVEQVDQTVMSVMTKVDTLTNKYLKDNVKK